MGCGDSRLPKPENIPAIDTSGLEKFSKFEHAFPFYRIRIDILEGRVKRFVNGKNSVTLEQLRFAFKDDPKFEDI